MAASRTRRARDRALRGGLAALALAMIPCAGFGQMPLSPVPIAAASPDTVRVSGTVADRATGRPLPSVSVRLTPLDLHRSPGWDGTSSPSGRFQSPFLLSGMYRLQVEALGFTPVSRDLVLGGAPELELQIEMVPEALELEPVVVTSVRRTRLDGSGFHERRRLGLGHTFDRDDIERRSPARVSDLFRTVPGVEVVTTRGRGGGDVRLRRGCMPDLLVDGIRIPNPGPLDDFLSVGDLEAIEVHHGGAGSLSLSGSTCGAIMAWTREGGPEEGRPHTLNRLVVALTVVGFGFLLAR